MNFIKDIISNKKRKVEIIARPISRTQLKKQAERFVRNYGEVIKKLSQE